MGHMVERVQIIVKGIVQGVGFRPAVYTLARSLELKGYVTNSSEGVLLDIEGTRVAEFVRRIRQESPPLSRITDLTVTPLPHLGYADFTIRASVDSADGHPFTLVSPDVSTCRDCLRELLDPSDRRYLYPFINCTNCGPRYSITTSVPYDRSNTTMAGFTLCPECQREYQDPADRRFHAQPNACAKCGPQVEYKVQSSEYKVRGAEAIQKTILSLKQGGIVAIRGIGGYHLACDAANDEAVGKLRERKRKSNKPFAVMAPDIKRIEQFCVVSEGERAVLLSNKRPIVLLKKTGHGVLGKAVSPNNNYLGCMLPYAPLHYLLFHHPIEGNPPVSPFSKGGRKIGPPLAKGGEGGFVTPPHFTALVMTSGNLSEEPIVRDNDEAIRKLSGIVDGFLQHDRDIFMRVDDSVVRVRSENNSELLFMRRSRGYAPEPIALHDEGPEALGCGADLKNTFTLTKGKYAIVSQHIGDMENYETVMFFEECLANLKAVYRSAPVAIVHDLHPGYLSTKWALEKGSRGRDQGEGNSELPTPNSKLSLFPIQHHYAHIGSVMAEHGLSAKVIGVALDGTGYGTDGNLWGGEFLIADIDGFNRVGQFKYVPLPGGEAAIREPWKTAVSYIMDATGDAAREHLENIGYAWNYGWEALGNLMAVARSRDFSPLASGAGRLFDAVSALLGVCDRNTFEGEAAMALEARVQDGIDEEYHVEFTVENGYTVIDFSPLIREIIVDLDEKPSREIISTKFHNTVVSVIRSMVRNLSEQYGLKDVALSGGTFQNVYLLNRTVQMLSRDGMNVYTNRQVPCNDACISLGQAYLVRERLKKQEEHV